MSALATMLDANAFPLAVCALAAAAAFAVVRTELQTDSWLTLVAGRLVAQNGLPAHDRLTVISAGASWVDQQWLAQLAFYGAWLAGGLKLVLLSSAALVGVAFSVLVRAARRSGGSATASALMAGPCFVVALPNTVMRAQTLAIALFAVLLALLLGELASPGRRVLLSLPLIALWANVHGSVVLAAGLVSLLGVTQLAEGRGGHSPSASRRLKATALLLLPWPLVCASPYELGLLGYYRDTLGNRAFGDLVGEWRASSIVSQPLFFALAFAALWLVVRYGARLRAFERLALVLAMAGGMLAVRNIVWFALLACAVLPRALDEAWTPRAAARRTQVNLAVVAVAFALLLATVVAVAARPSSWYEHGYPRGAADAVAHLAAGSPGVRVFASERFADWLLWERPELAGRIAYDARFELLSGRQLHAVADFWARRGTDWAAPAHGYGVLVIPGGDDRLVRDLRHELGARTRYRARAVTVLSRRT